MVNLTRGCEFPISGYGGEYGDVEVVNFLLLMYPEQPVSVAVRLLRTGAHFTTVLVLKVLRRMC